MRGDLGHVSAGTRYAFVIGIIALRTIVSLAYAVATLLFVDLRSAVFLLCGPKHCSLYF